ncbi:MAG: hypothetical protein KJ734_01420, partial [Chloroflexi bacterium]|nr:hypothetical protein [Chloroflexota bacterium]
MPWPPSAPYLIALTISAAISVALALYAWRHRPAPGAMPFVVLMLAVAEWTLVTAFRMASPDLPTKILWAQVRYVGIVIVPAAWLVFALAYTGQGQWLTRLPRVLLLAVEPAVFLLLVWTNPHHHLVWTDIQLDTSGGFPGWHAAHGVAYWFHAIYAYLLLLLATWHLVRVAVRTPQPLLYRRQAAILLLAAIAPATGCTLSTLDLSPWPFVDLAPFGFIVAGLFAVWGFYQLR